MSGGTPNYTQTDGFVNDALLEIRETMDRIILFTATLSYVEQARYYLRMNIALKHNKYRDTFDALRNIEAELRTGVKQS